MVNHSASLAGAAFGVWAAVLSTSCDTSNAPPPTVSGATDAALSDAGTPEAATDSGGASDVMTDVAASDDASDAASASDASDAASDSDASDAASDSDGGGSPGHDGATDAEAAD